MTSKDLLGFEFDQFQRYSFLSRVLAPLFGEGGARASVRPVRVLDVGAGPQRLTEAFLGARFEVVRCDVDSFGRDDIVVIEPGRRFPLGDSEFDIVLALEVLEHVPAPARDKFIGECIRVARDVAVFSTPIAAEAVAEAERRVAQAFEAENQVPHPFLSEHAELGVPEAGTVTAAIERHGALAVVAANARLDLWEAFLMLDQLLRTVPGGPQLAVDVCRVANSRSFGARAADAHYRNFYFAVKDASLEQLISEAARFEPREADTEPREPLYQLAKFVAGHLSDRSRAEDDVRRRLSEAEATAVPLAEIFLAATPPPRRRAWLSRILGATVLNAPFAAEPDEGVINLQWSHHSLWSFTSADARLACRGGFTRGLYELRGRAAAPSHARLEIAVDDQRGVASADLTPEPADIAVCFELVRPADTVTIAVLGEGSVALLGDLHFVKLVEEGPRARLTRNGIGWVRRHPVGARVVRSPGGRFIQRLIGPLPPFSDSYDYAAWIDERVARRSSFYSIAEAHSLSLLTSVWNTPAAYLRELGQSVLEWQDWRDFEWIVLDNGSTDPDTVAALGELDSDERVRFFRVEDNLGIIGGMRYCLEQAAADYVLPLDSDDLLYPDALRIMAWYIEKAGRPPLLYSDEDKLYRGRPRDPYFKSAWDPVLFLNSCYIAHLCAMDRRIALELGLYSDAEAEGCHDWDSFIRFMLAGHTPVHVPEVLYSWRMHSASAALNIDSKPYVSASHKRVLGRFLSTQQNAETYEVVTSPLFDRTPDWWFRRKHFDPRPILSVVLGNGEEMPRPVSGYVSHEVVSLSLDARVGELSGLVAREAARGALVHLVAGGVEMEGEEWPWEALAIMELHSDTVVVGGRVYDEGKRIVAAGEYFGFGGDCDCPDIGRHIEDPGYFAYMWKQRSVSAASTMLAIVEAAFLRETIDSAPAEATLAFLGAWTGAHAARKHKRVVYSPHVSGRGAVDRAAWEGLVTSAEREAFVRWNADVIPERRFLSPLLSLEPASAYQPVPAYTPLSGLEVAGRRSWTAQGSVVV
jgi:hypothetical protein